MVITYDPLRFNDSALFILDCDVNMIGEFGELRYIRSSRGGAYTSVISFSGDGTKVSAEYNNRGRYRYRYHIVDLEKGEVLLDELCHDRQVWDNPVWIDFVNSTVQ